MARNKLTNELICRAVLDQLMTDSHTPKVVCIPDDYRDGIVLECYVWGGAFYIELFGLDRTVSLAYLMERHIYPQITNGLHSVWAKAA